MVRHSAVNRARKHLWVRVPLRQPYYAPPDGHGDEPSKLVLVGSIPTRGTNFKSRFRINLTDKLK